MRKFCYVLLLSFITGFELKAQNLVPNPSFEDTLAFPSVLAQLNLANGWNNSYRLTPDLYHSCSVTFTNVPNACFGYQAAHSANAMAGYCLCWFT